ncbi:MFS transporter [Parasphingorhabdus sp.]|uniref:MFS transporter n=1 Tax=Parasphingorhabdus sp. TaxID=2709688 RepID=UPI003266F97B
MNDIRQKLPFMTKVAFGVGSMGEIVFLGMFNTFISIYYNQAIGLSNSLIGTAIMLAILGDAISDPVVGMISDRWRSRLGRRHPFLFAAPIPLAISLYLIFNPPEMLSGGVAGDPDQMGLFFWLMCWTVLARLFLTLYTIPHFALGGELTKDANDRSKLFSINSVFGYASGALFAFTAWGFFLAGESVLADGTVIPRHLDAKAYGPVVMTACSIILVSIFLSAMGTKNRIPLLSKPPIDQERFSLTSFYKDLLGALKNPNYAFIMAGYFLLMISVGMNETLQVFVYTYFWELQTEQIRWFGLASVPAIILGATLSPLLMKRFERKNVVIGGLLTLAIFVQLPIDLRLLGLMPANGSEMLMPLLIASVMIAAVGFAAGLVAILSMLGDISDQNELHTGLRQEGLIFSARAFFAKASNSAGHFVAGISLDLFIVLPFEAVPGELDSGVVWRLGVMSGPIMVSAALVSLVFYARYRLTRADHNRILDELSKDQKPEEIDDKASA